MEPNWDELKARLMAMTTKQLRQIGRSWFAGCLGGASTKAEYVGNMIAQMHHWWHHCAEWGGQDRVRNVLKDIAGVM